MINFESAAHVSTIKESIRMIVHQIENTNETEIIWKRRREPMKTSKVEKYNKWNLKID